MLPPLLLPLPPLLPPACEPGSREEKAEEATLLPPSRSSMSSA